MRVIVAVLIFIGTSVALAIAFLVVCILSWFCPPPGLTGLLGIGASTWATVAWLRSTKTQRVWSDLIAGGDRDEE